MEYVSLIMDIEKSRTYGIDDRIEIQNYMSDCVGMLNELFQQDIKFEVTFSGGDEMQGLFCDVTSAILYFRLLEMLLKPVKLRAGIGVGAWTIKVDNGLSTQQDGPVYHLARKAIDEVYKKQFHNIRICTGKDEDILANHLLNASVTLKTQQIYMQNIVLVIAELLCPFIKNQRKDISNKTIGALIQTKFNYKIGKRRNYNESRLNYYNENLNFDLPFYNSPIFIDGNISESEVPLTKKNMSSYIADILGCTRQNVDSIIRRGNVGKIRELDYVALQYIEKNYGENTWNYCL